MTETDFASTLRSLRKHDGGLGAQCIQASIARQLFGTGVSVEVAGTRFGVRRRLGAGAMGVVYEVEREGLSGLLALKVLHRAGTEQAYRLKREFRTLSRLGHPNLVVLHELYADGEGAAFTMERVHGDDFATHVQPGGRLDLERLLRTLAQLIDGLLALHAEGVIHRDLKPSNVLVTAEGRAVLLDLGVALLGPEHDVSGSTSYMAPEQQCGHSVPASDLYALGVMLERALSAPAPAGQWARAERARLRALSAQLQHPDPGQRPTPLQLLREIGVANAARSGPRQRACFVGRERELRELSQFAAQPRDRPRLVLVEGPSGGGKSALVAQLVQRHTQSPGQDERATLVLGARCCRRETVRYRALDPLLDALTDTLLHDEPQLARSLAEHITPPLLELFPVFERVYAPACEGVHEQLHDPRERRGAAIRALRKLLRRACGECGMVLCIDDAHWFDDDSFTLISELLTGPKAPAVLWLLAMRPQGAARCEQLAQRLPPQDVHRLTLGNLDARESLALAQAVLPDQQDLWQRASALSGGNPFVLTHLGQLVDDGQPVFEQAALERVIERRIEVLPAVARHVLQVVALSAEALPLDLLCRAVGASQSEIECALHLLEAQRYVRFAGGAAPCIEPYHDRIAELLHGAIAPTALAHQLCGQRVQEAAVIAPLREQGTAEPRRFLTSCAPLVAGIPRRG